MQRQFNGSYLRPFGSHTQRSQPQPAHIQAPMIYVYEATRWEYKVVTRNIEKEVLFPEEDLNALGRDGWELAGTATLPQQVQFYFKRLTSKSGGRQNDQR